MFCFTYNHGPIWCQFIKKWSQQTNNQVIVILVLYTNAACGYTHRHTHCLVLIYLFYTVRKQYANVLFASKLAQSRQILSMDKVAKWQARRTTSFWPKQLHCPETRHRHVKVDDGWRSAKKEETEYEKQSWIHKQLPQRPIHWNVYCPLNWTVFVQIDRQVAPCTDRVCSLHWWCSLRVMYLLAMARIISIWWLLIGSIPRLCSASDTKTLRPTKSVKTQCWILARTLVPIKGLCLGPIKCLIWCSADLHTAMTSAAGVISPPRSRNCKRPKSAR